MQALAHTAARGDQYNSFQFFGLCFEEEKPAKQISYA